MQNTRPALLTAVVSGAVAVLGALFGADQFAAQAGALALGALGVLVAARQEALRRVRWSLLTGIAVLAFGVVVPDILTPPASGPQVFVPASGGTGRFVHDVVAGEWLTTVAVLLACAAFLWAVLSATARRWAKPAIVAAAAGSLVVIVAVADLAVAAAGQRRDGAARELISVVAFPLAVVVTAIVAAVWGAYRAGSGLVAAGGLLVAVPALAVVYQGVLSAPLPYGYAHQLIFDAAVVRTGWGDLDPIAALTVAGCLGGAACVVLGCLREARLPTP